MTTIHPTAIVDSKAEIGPNVEIGAYCVIGAYVEIGSGTKLHNHVTVEGPTTIGRDNEVYPFSVIGAAPQDLKYRGEHAVCVVGDRNQIREHVTIHRGTQNGGGVTRVGNDNLVMVAAHIAHDCVVGSHCVIANQVMIGGHAVIEDMVTIGGGAGIHHFATVGKLAFIGGLARIKKDVPPFMIVEGDPAEVRGVNTIGLTRRQYSDHEIAAIRDAYKRLFKQQQQQQQHQQHPQQSQQPAPTDQFSHATVTRAPDRIAGAEFNGHPAAAAAAAATSPTRLAMSSEIESLLQQYAAMPAVVQLCDSLRNSAKGIRGRYAETAREDSKYATQPK